MMDVARPWLAAAALAGCVLLTGCAGPADRADDPTEAAVEPDVNPSDEPSQPTQPTTGTPVAPSRGSSTLALAVADLAAAQDVTEAEVQVVSVDEVTWRDGSLGCAQKGMAYTQALVDGSRIVLRVGGTDYEYHSRRGGAPFHCPRPTQ